MNKFGENALRFKEWVDDDPKVLRALVQSCLGPSGYARLGKIVQARPEHVASIPPGGLKHILQSVGGYEFWNLRGGVGVRPRLTRTQERVVGPQDQQVQAPRVVTGLQKVLVTVGEIQSLCPNASIRIELPGGVLVERSG